MQYAAFGMQSAFVKMEDLQGMFSSSEGYYP